MPGDRDRVRVNVGTERERTEISSSSFDVLVLGDFSGRGLGDEDTGGPTLESRVPRPVDRDELERVMEEIAPELRLELSAGERRRKVRTRFERLEHFHPDQLARRVDAFDELVDLYRRLERGEVSSPSSAGGDAPTGEAPGDDGGGDSAPRGSGGSVLDDIVSRSEGSGPDGSGPEGTGRSERKAGSPDDAFSEYLRELVRPHLVKEEGAAPEDRELLEHLREALEGGMRSLIHHPAFQDLEATWRGLSFLVHRVESGSGVGIRLLDVSKVELERDLERAAAGDESVLEQRLVEDRAGTPGAGPWSLLVGLFSFGPDDAGLLEGLGRLGRSAGAPFLASAAPSLVGLPSYARRPERADWDAPGGGPAWRELRHSDVAPWLGLAAPRFLLRLPYGPEDAPCDVFPFREMTSPPRHGDYLWGNPALLCASLLAESFARQGPEMRPGSRREVDRLPLHLYSREGSTEATPCAEMLMTDSAASELVDRGFIPVASVKERNLVRVVRFQSIADPPSRLRGPWSG